MKRSAFTAIVFLSQLGFELWIIAHEKEKEFLKGLHVAASEF